MRNRIRVGSAIVLGVVLALSGGSVRADADYDYREANGAENAIWMDGLLDDYNAGRLSEADLLRELWAERPGVMTVLYDEYGSFTTCFQYDLIGFESNGVKFIQGGSRVFFDTAAFLDGSGQVIPGYERQYNNAVRANGILNDVWDYVDAFCPLCPPNNQCCKEHLTTPPSTSCEPLNTKRCCNTGADEPNCTQSQGNPCPTP